MKDCQGSFTIEAALVVSLIIFALMTVVLTTFYLRDVCAAAARIRLDSLGDRVAELDPEPTPVLTLTRGSLEGSDGGNGAALEMTGLWPLSRLNYAETVRREEQDPVARLRQLRQEGLR